MLTALAGAIVLAVLSTFYDFMWAHFEVRHNVINGLVHGMTLLSVAGARAGMAAAEAGGGTGGRRHSGPAGRRVVLRVLSPARVSVGHRRGLDAAVAALCRARGVAAPRADGQRGRCCCGALARRCCRAARSTWYRACGPTTARRRTTSGTSPRGRSRSSRGLRRCCATETLRRSHGHSVRATRRDGGAEFGSAVSRSPYHQATTPQSASDD